MIIEGKSFPINGYFILPIITSFHYRGIDRDPFEPTLIMGELDVSVLLSDDETEVWKFYPPGWRREAYQLYEKNKVPEWGDDDLLGDRGVGHEIVRIIEPHIGKHEIVECVISTSDDIPRSHLIDRANFLGYDLAYPGGNYYSAILNGLIGDNKNEELVNKYGDLLNSYGLFRNPKPLQSYLDEFRKVVISEENSVFCVYQMSLI